MKYLIRTRMGDCDYAYPVNGVPIKFQGFEPVRFFIEKCKRKGYSISEVQTGHAIIHPAEFIDNREIAIQKAKERLNKHGLKHVLNVIAQTTPVSGLREYKKFIISRGK